MRRILALLVGLVLAAPAFSQQQIINTGAAPNSGTGDTLQVWATKDNENFSQLFSILGGCAVLPCPATFATPVTINNTLTVTGSTTIGGNLGVMGSGTFAGPVTAPSLALPLNGLLAGEGASTPIAIANAQNVANSVNGFLGPRTTTEIAANVIPSNFGYPAGDVRRYGAVGDGVTDDSGAIQAALNVAAVTTTANNRQPVVLPAGANYFLASGITIPPTVYMYGQGNDPSQNGFSTTLTCALAVPTCITIGGFNAAPGAGLSNVNVWRQSGTIPAGSIGVLVQDGTQVTMSHVGIYRNAVALKLAKDPNGVGGGLGFNGDNIYTGAVSDAHLVMDTWAEARFVNSRFGSNGGLDMNATTYIRIQGGSTTEGGAGPNGLFMVNCQMNQGGGGSPMHGIEFVNQTAGSISAMDEFYFVNTHWENIATGGAFIYSDGTWPSIEAIRIQNSWFSPDNSGTNFMALNAGTTLNQFFLGSSYVGDPFVLAPTNAFSEVILQGNSLQTNVTVSGAGTTSTFVSTGNVIDGTLTLTGTFKALKEADAAVSSLAFSATGTNTNSINLDYTGTWTPTITFGGASTGNVYSHQSGTYHISGPMICGTYRVGLSTLGSATGGAGIGGQPFPSSSEDSTNGGGGIIVGSSGTTGVGGSSTLTTQAVQSGTGWAINTSTATGTVQLNNAQFTSSTLLNGNFCYQWQ